MHWFPAPVVACYLLCATMALIAVLLRVRCGSWSNPSVVFAIFWCMMTLLPIVFVPEIEPSINAVGYITTAVLAFSLPAAAFSWRMPLAANAVRQGNSASPFFSGNEAILLLATMQIATLGSIVANLAYQGFPIGAFFVDPFSLGCKYLGYRYGGSAKPFALAQVGTVLNYVAAPLAGLIVAHRKSYFVSMGVVFLCLLPSLYDIAIYADKGTVFLTLAFFYGAVVVGRIRQGRTSLVTWRSVLSMPLLLLVLVTAIGFAMINRTSTACEQQQTARIAGEFMSSIKGGGPASNDGGGGSGVKYNMRSYAFGHLFAFSAWYDHYISLARVLKSSDALGPDWYQKWTTLNGAKEHRGPSEQQTARSAGEFMSFNKGSEPASNDGGGGVKYNMRSYAFGHLFAFSEWYDHYISPGRDLKSSDAPGPDRYQRSTTLNGAKEYKDPSGPTYGFWTFMALGKHVNPGYFKSLPDGYFDEYFMRKNVLQSNIHTFFRGLIYDFTIPGSLAALAVASFLFNLAYRRLLLNAEAPLSQVLYIFFAGYLYTSYIISLLIWSSVIASGLLTLLMLSLIGYIDGHGGSLAEALKRRRRQTGNTEVVN